MHPYSITKKLTLATLEPLSINWQLKLNVCPHAMEKKVWGKDLCSNVAQILRQNKARKEIFETVVPYTVKTQNGHKIHVLKFN